MELLGSYYKHQRQTISVFSLLSEAEECLQKAETLTGNTNEKIPRKRARALTETEVDELIQAYQNGDSTYTLGRRFGINRQTVSQQLRRAGVPTRVYRPR